MFVRRRYRPFERNVATMEWTSLNDLREQFLSFFESKEHTRLASFPLVPIGDSSLLLINSGMAPMKKFFLGQAVPPNKRVTTCQKCIRTPDIENVGKTSRHGTFFEMLGNFSFGDYFKHEATKWAWEFITEVVKMPLDRLWVSIYEDDDEAFDIWVNEVGVDPKRIVRLGKEDNFWEIGSGPCGPCSEIYFDRGEEYGCGKPTCGVGCDCDRYVEFWNLVFSQFNGDGDGHYERMEHPNIDTGMGLERLACITQGVDNLFEVDTIQNIMKHISRIAGVSYKENEKTDVSLRVITDHVRSTVFMVGDGVLPSNEGRGYVLRRLLRRAARHGRLLGIDKPFLFEVVDTVIHENRTAYPELGQKADYIKKVVRVEEENFGKTVDKGMELLSSILDRMESKEEKILTGDDAFKLYDTFGFPLDLTMEITAERGISVDEARFTELMKEQRERARTAHFAGGDVAWKDDALELSAYPATEFTGYEMFSCDAEILALAAEGELAGEINAGSKGVVVLDRTPFYAESGGQIADIGVIKTGNGLFRVTDCQKDDGGHFIHYGAVEEGSVSVGETAQSEVDAPNRRAVMRNHTSAHLLQAALRKTLGNYVHQAGQLVTAQRLRFDFSHFQALTPEELKTIELDVNSAILSAVDVKLYETDIEAAKAKGAMALFGEKYGDVVRVCDIGEYSIELCGGTHVDNTGKIGLFKIVSESSVAAGVRRIEAVTGAGVLELIDGTNEMLAKCCQTLKVTNPAELPDRCAALSAELKEKEKLLEKINAEFAEIQAKGVAENTVEVGGLRVASFLFHNANPESLKKIADKMTGSIPNSVLVVGTIRDGKGTLVAACGPQAIEKGVVAGVVIKEIAAIAGGKGGGRPNMAMAGVSDPYKMDEALSFLPSLVEKLTSL